MTEYTSSRLLIDEKPLQILPQLAVAIGLNEAIIVQQLHYWLRTNPHYHDGRRWIYNTYPQWKKNFPFWSVDTIKRTILRLEKEGIIETTDRYNTNSSDRTKWYTINYGHAVWDMCRAESPDEEGNLPPSGEGNLPHSSYTETTTESSAPDQGNKKTSKVSKPLPANGPEQQVVKAFYESIGVSQPPNYAKAIGQAKTLLKMGVDPSEIPAMVEWAKGQWFAKDGFNLADLAKFAENYRTSGASSSPTPAPDRDLTQEELRKYSRFTDWHGIYEPGSDGFRQWQQDYFNGTLRQRRKA